MAILAQTYWYEQAIGTRAVAVVLVFVVGAAIAGFLASLVAFWFTAQRPWPVRAAVSLLLLALATASVTAFVHFLQYRLYFAIFQAQELNRHWVWQTLFTGAGSLVVFLVVGLRLLLPIGIVALFTSSALFVWWTRRR